MRRTSIFLSAFSLSIVAACSPPINITLGGPAQSSTPPSVTPIDGIDPAHPNIMRLTQTLDLKDIRGLRVTLSHASLKVQQDESIPTALLKTTQTISTPFLGADVLQTLLQGSQVTAAPSFVDASRLDITAPLPPSLNPNDISYDLQIIVPHGVNLETFFDDGPVAVTGLAGNVELHTTNGAIDLSNIGGGANVHTTAKPVNASEVSGSVVAETTAADITLHLSPPNGATVGAKTTEGKIRLLVANTTAASLSLVTDAGNVSADSTGFAISNVSTSSGVFKAMLNGGGGTLDIHTTKGDLQFGGF